MYQVPSTHYDNNVKLREYMLGAAMCTTVDVLVKLKFAKN